MVTLYIITFVLCCIVVGFKFVATKQHSDIFNLLFKISFVIAILLLMLSFIVCFCDIIQNKLITKYDMKIESISISQNYVDIEKTDDLYELSVGDKVCMTVVLNYTFENYYNGDVDMLWVVSGNERYLAYSRILLPPDLKLKKGDIYSHTITLEFTPTAEGEKTFDIKSGNKGVLSDITFKFS